MFTASRPAQREAFLDREPALARLRRTVERLAAGAPEWLAIVGPRKVGKTSLVLEASHRYARPDLRFVVLDVFESMPPSLEVFRRLAARSLDALFSGDAGAAPSRLLGEPARYRRALLESAAFRALPADLQSSVLELADRPLDAHLLADTLELPERLADALDVRLLVAIDEFQELAALGSTRGAPDPLPLMRSIWQRHRRVTYVISGSARSTLTELVTSSRSPFFQHFEILSLGPFDRPDAIDLLVTAAPDDRPIPRELAEHAVDVLGGHPFYLQLFGAELTAREPPYDARALKETLQALVFSRTGRLGLHFENEHARLVGSSLGAAATLSALAEGPARITDVARAIGGSTGTANQYVKRLGDAVRKREDGLYELDDAVFATWLKWRAPGGSVVPMSVVGDEAELATARALSAMGFDLVYQSRGSRGAFDLLALRGPTQLAVQVKRSPLPLRFTRSEWNRMEADAKRWGWQWVVASVGGDGSVVFLDPKRVVKQREARLGERARIDNLLLHLG